MPRRTLAVLFFVTAVAALLPIWTVEHVAMVDLPQHIAQLDHYKKMGDPDWRWRELFVVHHLTPYLLSYCVTLVFSSVLPVVDAFRVTLSLAVLALPLSTAFLLRRAGAPVFLALLAFPLAYGFCWSFGFVSYVTAIPIAITWVAASWSERPPSWSGALGLFVLGTLCFVAHIVAWGFAGLAAALLALRFGDPRAIARIWVPLLATTVLAGLWVVEGPSEAPMASTETLWMYGPGARLVFLPLIWAGGIYDVDIPRVIAGVGLLFAPLALGMRFDRKSPALWLAGLATLLYFAFPMRLLGVMFLYERFAVYVVVMLYAAMRLPKGHLRPAVVLTALSVAWLGHLTIQARAFDAEASDLRPLLEEMDPGRARGLVFVRESPFAEGPIYWHLPALYAVYRDGLYEPSFASYFDEVVQFRDLAAAYRADEPDEGLEPCLYDYYVVREPEEYERWLQERIGHCHQPGPSSGTWQLWTRKERP